MTKHLWEVKHPYHCELGNYYAAPNANLHREYDSWAEFAADWAKGEDNDYNLLFRWDWIKETDKESPYFDHGKRKGMDRLMLFYVMQRQAYNMSVAIGVKDSNEPAVREYLEAKAQHIRTLWEPLIDLTVDEAMEQLI